VLGRLPGVRNVKADHRAQKVQFSLEQGKTSIGEVIKKLEFMGYRVVPSG
jgi:copper chaperone CopZ